MGERTAGAELNDDPACAGIVLGPFAVVLCLGLGGAGAFAAAGGGVES